jgi:hypothetical protein
VRELNEHAAKLQQLATQVQQHRALSEEQPAVQKNHASAAEEVSRLEAQVRVIARLLPARVYSWSACRRYLGMQLRMALAATPHCKSLQRSTQRSAIARTLLEAHGCAARRRQGSS